MLITDNNRATSLQMPHGYLLAKEKTMGAKSVVGLIIAGVMLFVIPAAAQNAGYIAGVVTDTSGTPLDGVVAVAGDSLAMDTSDPAGNYILGGLAPGSYFLYFYKANYGIGYFGWIDVTSDDTTLLDVELLPGCDYISGDVNGNGYVNGVDVLYIIAWAHGGPPPPDRCYCPPLQFPFYAACDVNGNCAFNGIDVTYFVAYFRGMQSDIRFCVSCPPIYYGP
jgi:hypothetical protein